MIAIEHTTTAIRTERLASAPVLVIISAIIILISLVGIGIFYVWTGMKVIQLIEKAARELTGGNSRVTIRVCVFCTNTYTLSDHKTVDNDWI
jgi:hypothetical protein